MKVARVLIVKFGAIGDVIMAVPAAHALHLRGYAIDWVCGAGVAPLLECYPWIRVIVAEDKSILKGSSLQRLKALGQVWRQVAGMRYDLCATLYYDARYKVIAWPVKATRKVLLSRSERETKLVGSRHHTDEYARILLGEEDSCRDSSREPLRPEFLPPSPLTLATRTRIGLVPGGASNMLRQQTLRRWPVDRYLKVAQALLSRGYEVVLLGGPDDVWVRPQFAGLEVLDLLGKLSLPEVISVSDTCEVVISHDTGPLHLAALSRAGLVALFGPTDPGNFAPRRSGVRCLWGGEGFACRPCYDGRDFAPCRDNGCMQQIGIQRVLDTIEELRRERMIFSKGDQR